MLAGGQYTAMSKIALKSSLRSTVGNLGISFVCALAARATSLSAISIASAGDRGSSRANPMTKILIRVSSIRLASDIKCRMALLSASGGQLSLLW